MPLTFEEAAAEARQRAAAERAGQGAVAQWLQDLRARSRRASIVLRARQGNPRTLTSTSSELNPAWLTIGAMLLRRRR